MTHADTETTRKKLLFRSWHRGCKETDLLLGHFCDAYLPTMTMEELHQFEAVLELDDADLYRWYTGEMPPPAEAASNPMLARVLAFEVAEVLQGIKSR